MDKTDKILEQLQSLAANISAMDEKMDKKFNNLEQRMDNIDARMERMEQNIATLIYANTSLAQEMRASNENLQKQIDNHSIDIARLRAAM